MSPDVIHEYDSVRFCTDQAGAGLHTARVEERNYMKTAERVRLELPLVLPEIDDPNDPSIG
jgi:hypothetical protein